jgi:hypothetical protein
MKHKARGRHRRRRERRACLGEMLHIDGSKHAWLSLLAGEKQTLITVLDDATSRRLYHHRTGRACPIDSEAST